jgi:hypothetical protein
MMRDVAEEAQRSADAARQGLRTVQVGGVVVVVGGVRVG